MPVTSAVRSYCCYGLNWLDVSSNGTGSYKAIVALSRVLTGACNAKAQGHILHSVVLPTSCLTYI